MGFHLLAMANLAIIFAAVFIPANLRDKQQQKQNIKEAERIINSQKQ